MNERSRPRITWLGRTILDLSARAEEAEERVWRRSTTGRRRGRAFWSRPWVGITGLGIAASILVSVSVGVLMNNEESASEGDAAANAAQMEEMRQFALYLVAGAANEQD